MVYVLCLILFMVGLYGVVTQKNLIKIIIGVMIMEAAVNLMLILVGYRRAGVAPIIDQTVSHSDVVASGVDPLPQAMVLTAIVIGLGVLALLVTIALRLYHRYGTYDITRIRELRG